MSVKTVDKANIEHLDYIGKVLFTLIELPPAHAAVVCEDVIVLLMLAISARISMVEALKTHNELMAEYRAPEQKGSTS